MASPLEEKTVTEDDMSRMTFALVNSLFYYGHAILDIDNPETIKGSYELIDAIANDAKRNLLLYLTEEENK